MKVSKVVCKIFVIMAHAIRLKDLYEDDRVGDLLRYDAFAPCCNYKPQALWGTMGFQGTQCQTLNLRLCRIGTRISS